MNAPSVVVWADAARVMARFLIRCKADYMMAIGEDQTDFTPGHARVVTPQGDVEQVPASPNDIWPTGDEGGLYDDGETPDCFIEGWAGSSDFEAALIETVPGSENRGDLLTATEADEWLQRFATKVELTLERSLRSIPTYRSWQGFQRFKRCIAKNLSQASAEMEGNWLKRREPSGPRKLSSRLKPGFKRTRNVYVPETDLQSAKANKQWTWGGGEKFRRHGFEAYHWPRGRPPLPASEWRKRYVARYKKRFPGKPLGRPRKDGLPPGSVYTVKVPFPRGLKYGYVWRHQLPRKRWWSKYFSKRDLRKRVTSAPANLIKEKLRLFLKQWAENHHRHPGGRRRVCGVKVPSRPRRRKLKSGETRRQLIMVIRKQFITTQHPKPPHVKRRKRVFKAEKVKVPTVKLGPRPDLTEWQRRRAMR